MWTTSWMCSLLLGVIALVEANPLDNEEPQEYCQWEDFNATCASDHVIVMQIARYGRMKLGRCIPRDYYIGCSGNVLPEADVRCSGRNTCVIQLPDNVLHGLQPCPKDLMAYLEASYTCVPVATGKGQQCRVDKPVLLESTSGYIANIITENSGFGSNYCPWRIQVKPGQRVNLTLMVFAELNYNQDSAMALKPDICQVYAKIRDDTKVKDLVACGQHNREMHILVSDSNIVDIEIINHEIQRERLYFIIKYQEVDLVADLHAFLNNYKPPAYYDLPPIEHMYDTVKVLYEILGGKDTFLGLIQAADNFLAWSMLNGFPSLPFTGVTEDMLHGAIMAAFNGVRPVMMVAMSDWVAMAEPRLRDLAHALAVSKTVEEFEDNIRWDDAEQFLQMAFIIKPESRIYREILAFFRTLVVEFDKHGPLSEPHFENSIEG